MSSPPPPDLPSDGVPPITEPIPTFDRRPTFRQSFAAIAVFNYRLYLGALILGSTGGWMARVAIDWLVLELTGERRPVALAAGLASAADASAQHEVGVAHAAELTRAVLDGGAPGVHLYAFNNHDTVLTVLQRAGVVPVAARS